MGAISGVNGAVYWNEYMLDTATTGTLYFSSGGTILASSSGGSGSTGAMLDFETLGYKANMLIAVSGCSYAVGSTGTSTTGNNQIITLATVSSGLMTVSTGDTLITSTSGEAAAVTFTQQNPGLEQAGFYNWTINYKINLLDKTAFDTSSGGRSYVSGITEWTASADKWFFSTGNNASSWVGETVKVRFFINYVAIPSTGSPSKYYEGDTIVTGMDVGSPVDALITQTVSFQGVGALTPTTKTAAWNTTE